MPQIWLTDKELGQFLARDAEDARRFTIEDGWARRKCSDGLSRVKLPAAMVCAFILHAAQTFDQDRLTDLMVSDLRGVLAQTTALPMQRERIAAAG